nr:RNA-directed DNA polymerase, eukaryota, reverse transcriptase zinc-binding domain protein [Tanacetum cinerariifolium]
HDLRSNKASWVKWSNVLTPKEKGGLGVSSLYALNKGLLFKWVWKFYAQKSSLWARVIKAIHGVDGRMGKAINSGASSCWTSIVREVKVLKQQGVNFFEYLQLNMGNGESTTFWEDSWEDRWLEGGGIEQVQYEELSDMVNLISLISKNDRSRTRWVKYVPIKVNVTAWKIKIDALPTRLNISRRDMDIQSLSCPTRDCGVESSRHLFFQCNLYLGPRAHRNGHFRDYFYGFLKLWIGGGKDMQDEEEAGDKGYDKNKNFDESKGNDVGLFASAEYDKEDKEADAVWDEIDKRMDSRRKDKRFTCL